MALGALCQENPAFCVGYCCIIFITSCVLFGLSFDVVKPNHVAIVYNKNILHLDLREVYTPGRYVLGIGKAFIQFPTTYQSVRMGSEFGSHADAGDVLCRTSEGLVMRMEVALQYLLSTKLQDLVRLYLDFGETYHQVYIKQAQAGIRDGCADFTADEFTQNRTMLAENLHAKVRPRFNRSYAAVPSFELVNMEFDKQYATAIEQTQIAKQDVLLAENEYKVAEVDAERAKAEAETLATLTVRNALATNVSLAAAAQAEAELLAVRIQQQTEALQTLRTDLSLNTSKQLLAYHFFAVLEEVKVSKMIMGLPYPSTIQALIGVQTPPTAGP
eukprot:gb/GEZN01009994.1/.p1 GENE.gb/GEZN01009994.1/~~gb/GEZN01009994.1/.p1  ORF type:complete len:362 (-),score=57.24 gb/GEZN01009994.1/:192-1181(-)